MFINNLSNKFSRIRALLRSVILTRFILLCYLVVSSIASVHAFPDLATTSAPLSVASHHSLNLATPDITKTSVASTSETMPDCHQVGQLNNSEEISMSLCKIFCAAMANAIATEFVLELPLLLISNEIVFLDKVFNTREFTLEPHPPK